MYASVFFFFFFLFFKMPVSNPRQESQAMWVVFIFQGLCVPPCPKYQCFCVQAHSAHHMRGQLI